MRRMWWALVIVLGVLMSGLLVWQYIVGRGPVESIDAYGEEIGTL